MYHKVFTNYTLEFALEYSRKKKWERKQMEKNILKMLLLNLSDRYMGVHYTIIFLGSFGNAPWKGFLMLKKIIENFPSASAVGLNVIITNDRQKKIESEKIGF